VFLAVVYNFFSKGVNNMTSKEKYKAMREIFNKSFAEKEAELDKFYNELIAYLGSEECLAKYGDLKEKVCDNEGYRVVARKRILSK
jgi:hypothetical protein